MVDDVRFHLVKAGFIKVDKIHLVDDDSHLADSEQMQQIAVATGLVAHAFGRIDHEQSSVRLGRPGYHVAQEFRVSWRVNQNDVTRGGAKTDLAGVERNALLTFGLQRVQEKRPLEGLAVPGAGGLQCLEFALR